MKVCEFNNSVFLVVSDFYSNFIEVACLGNLTSRAVIKELKAIFAQYGVPNTLVMDNSSQFSSAKFAVFLKTWMFEHKTSLQTYPQSNEKAVYCSVCHRDNRPCSCSDQQQQKKKTTKQQKQSSDGDTPGYNDFRNSKTTC